MNYRYCFTPTQYIVLTLLQHKGLSRQEAALSLGVTVNNVYSLEQKLLSLQKRAYITYLSETIKLVDVDTIEQECSEIYDAYGETCFVVAYLEQKYGAWLNTFREGDPPSGFALADRKELEPCPSFIRKKRREVEKPELFVKMNLAFAEDEVGWDRIEMTPIEREIMQTSKNAPCLAKKLDTTPELVRVLRRNAKAVSFHNLLYTISLNAGIPFADLCREERSTDFRMTAWGAKEKYFREKYAGYL